MPESVTALAPCRGTASTSGSAVRLAVLVFALATGGCRTLAPAPDSLHVPLRCDGTPVGEVSGPFETYVSPDRTYARLTLRTSGHVDLVRSLPASETKSSAGVLREPISLGARRFDRVDLCFAPPLVPVELRGYQPSAAPTRFSALGRTITLAAAELCFANADVDEPYVLAIADWHEDGLHVFLEAAADPSAKDPPPVRLWSVPARPENELLARLIR